MLISNSTNAQTLYKDTQFQDTTFFGLNQSGTNKHALAKTIAKAEAQLLEDIPRDQDQVPQEMLKQSKAQFLRLQTSLNQNSATKPSFKDSLKAMPFYVKNNLLTRDPVTNDYYSIDYCSVRVKHGRFKPPTG